jgi:hypothetical protein
MWFMEDPLRLGRQVVFLNIPLLLVISDHVEVAGTPRPESSKAPGMRVDRVSAIRGFDRSLPEVRAGRDTQLRLVSVHLARQ